MCATQQYSMKIGTYIPLWYVQPMSNPLYMSLLCTWPGANTILADRLLRMLTLPILIRSPVTVIVPKVRFFLGWRQC